MPPTPTVDWKPWKLWQLAGPGCGASIVEIPIQWALDDGEQYCYLPDISGSGPIESPRGPLDLWSLEFEALRQPPCGRHGPRAHRHPSPRGVQDIQWTYRP